MHQSSAAGVANQGACSNSAKLRQKNKTCSSENNSEYTPSNRPTLVRASAPSRYLRRKGLMPDFKILQTITGNDRTLCISPCSSTASCSSKPSSPRTTIFSNSAVKQSFPCLPSLTNDNLSRLMSQLEPPSNSLLEAQRQSRTCVGPSTFPKSHFSSEASAHSDSDFSES